MQSLGGVGFCSVCQEALVTAIYAKARPMDLHAPVADSLTVTSATQQLTFSLDLLQPATHSLGVQWRTNGVTVTGATNPVFNLWPVQLGNGTKTVEADVWDPTAMVRTNSPNLKQTNVWTLSLTLPALPAMPLMPLTNGQRVSNSVLTVVGTAATDGYLAAVDYQFNHAGWTPTGGTTNWSVTLNLLPGTNVFQVFAVDVNGVRSPTNTVLIDCVVTNPVTVQTVGLGTLSPNYSNAWLEIGRNYTMTATPGSGFAFTNWTVSTNGPGGVTTNQTTVQFMMASNLTLVAGFVDGQKPAVSLTNFLGGQRVSNLLFTVRGTASDNWRVVGVWCQINHSVWLPAGTTNAFTNWFAANLSLIAGTNLISAYASDPAGDYSSTNTLALVATNVLAPTNAAAPVVRLTDPQMTPGGLQFNLQISGEDLGLIQVSTDLAHWDTVTNFAGANTNLLFCDPATHPPQRFYRVGP
jgi:hypothetical protein